MAEDCWAQGLSAARVEKYYYNFKTILGDLAPQDFLLSEASKQDIKKVVSRIERSDYSANTKHDFKVALKKYYRTKNEGNLPDKAQFFNTTIDKNKKKLPQNLLSKKEIESLIQTSTNTRDKALISVLYESGTRIGELMSLKLKNVKFDENGAVIQVHGKTGSRRIRLIESERFLRNWIQDHPSDEEEAPLWVKVEQYAEEKEYEKLRYGAIRTMLRKKAKKAGVSVKKVFPHNFRHSRATELANELTEAQMCEYFGWVQGSDQPATYVHLSGRDIDKKILEIHGIQKEENGKASKRCSVCGKLNPPGEDFCRNCMRPLNREAAEKADKAKEGMNSLQDWMIENDVSKEELKEELVEILK